LVKLHYKILLCVCGSLLVLMIALFLVWQYIVVDRFGQVEKEYANQNMERAVSAVDQDITSVATGTSDWAIWDDTYIFAEDLNQDYVDANFQASSFNSLRMNMILVLDTYGQLIHGEAFDLESGEMVPIPSDVLQHLSGDSPLIQHAETDTGTAGILLLPEGPLLVASQPILNSQREGPIHGTLIMARYFDSSELEYVGTLTRLPLTSYPLDAAGLPPDFQTAQASLTAGDAVVTHALSKDSIAGYALLDDIDGNPALILRAEMPRYIYNAGQNTIVYALISLAAIGLVVGAAIVVMLQITVLSRLTRLGRHVESIAQSGDLEQEIRVDSKDEIGRLAAAYSSLLDYMKDMASVTKRVASGDLTVEVKPKSDRDVLGNAFSQMVLQQRELISAIKSTTTQVADASDKFTEASQQTAHATQQIVATIQQVAKAAADQSASSLGTRAGMVELSGAIKQIAEGAEVQAAGVEDATAIVKQVSAAIDQVSSNARAGVETWNTTAASAAQGARMAHDTVTGMNRVKQAMDLVALKMTDLGGRSEEIGKIVATIDDISAQTNLLALNAAIEAARAGDQGRGFAVVADEVRKLAERASVATKEIAVLVSGIQAGVKEAVNAMHQGGKEVDSGYRLASDAGQALDAILTRSKDVNTQVDRILAAADQLNTLSARTAEAIDRINRIIEQNAAATEQMVRGSKEVSASVESSASVAEQNISAAEEVSVSVDKMSAQAEEALSAAHSLAEMSDEMERAVSVFKVQV
jgi:methyl-accepting chemotaxis protein